MNFPPVDVKQLRADYPLTAIAGQDVELHFRKGGTEARGPCYFCGKGDDRFGISIPEQTFWCRQCGKKGDVIQYVMLKEKIDFIGATYHLTGNKPSKVSKNGKLVGRPHRSEPLSKESREKWRWQLELFSQQAIYHLVEGRSTPARSALAWLVQRGIRLTEIKNAGLGYNDHWRQVVDDIKLPPGILIPRWGTDTEVTAINVYLSKSARDTTERTRMMVRGSIAKSFWMAMRIPDFETIVIVEGELDAILLNRFLPPFATSITCGGSSCMPDDLSILEDKRVILCMDGDEAGQQGLERWLEKLPGATVATIPAGKDITDAWRSGVKLDEWVGNYLQRS